MHDHEVLVKDIKHNKDTVSRAERSSSLPWGFWSFRVSCWEGQ